MASVRSIAQAAGVSTATVSRVLNNHPAVSDQMRQRVQSAAERRRLEESTTSGVGSRRRVQTIALLYTGQIALRSPFDGALADGIIAAFNKDIGGLEVLSAKQLLEQHDSLVDALRHRGVDGVLVRTTADSRHLADELFDSDLPAVVICDRPDHPEASFIAGSSRQAVEETIQHLVSIGHERIAMVNSLLVDTDHQERYDGFAEAMNEAGLEVLPQHVMQVWPYRHGGASAINRVMSERDRPTAVFFADMGAAMGAAKRAFDLGISIPQDLSIAAVDDTDLRFMVCPTLTCVCQQSMPAGENACLMLQQLMRDPDSGPLRQTIPYWLEVHQSTGKPPTNPMPR